MFVVCRLLLILGVMIRSYFYHIDKRGRVWHDGTEIADERFLHIFYRLMTTNTTRDHTDYPFLSPCGREQNFARAEDTPVVFHKLVDRRLYYAPELSVALQPETLRFSQDGVLYHEAPVGGVGRIDAVPALELCEHIRPWGPYFALEQDGRATVIEPLEPEPRYRVIRPRPQNLCFGCGPAHPFGPALSFLYDTTDRSVRTWLTPDVRMQGGTGWMHGGFIALLLDEVMGKTLSANDMGGAPTAKLEVNFRKPARLGVPMELVGRLEEHAGRKYTLTGELREAAGERVLLAEGSGLFIRPLRRAVQPGEAEKGTE